MKLYDSLTPTLTTWALHQPVFFISSAPLTGRHINLSPKGLSSSTLSILSPNQVAYFDRGGSGIETIAHLYENGRATLMFMSLGTTPRILRLFCTGRVVEWADQPAFDHWLGKMGRPRPEGVRAIVVLDVFTVQTSCGFGVPRVRRELWDRKGVNNAEEGQEEEEEDDEQDVGGDEEGERTVFRDELSVFEDRPTLGNFWSGREKAGTVLEYQAQKNLKSLDGLPGLRVARRADGQRLWVGDARAWMRRVSKETNGMVVGFLMAVLVYLVMRAVDSSGVLPGLVL